MAGAFTGIKLHHLVTEKSLTGLEL